MNKNKTINLVADVIAPLAVILVTVALFFIFEPEEPGTLFWTNLVYTVFLEIILFAYISWLPSHGSSVAFKWMEGIYSVVYICISLIWMLIFSALLRHWCPIKLYFAGIAVLTVLWILVGALTLKVDNAHETSTATLADNRRRVDSVNSNADMLLQQFNLMVAAHPELNSVSQSVAALCRGLATLSPTVMADPTAAKRVNSICSELEDRLAEPVSDAFAANLKEYADKAFLTLNNLKKSVRK